LRPESTSRRRFFEEGEDMGEENFKWMTQFGLFPADVVLAGGPTTPPLPIRLRKTYSFWADAGSIPDWSIAGLANQEMGICDAW
jgi:hypothetical protein